MTMEMGGPLDDGGITPSDDPFALFAAWMKEAQASEPNDANAMALATADADGRPNVRMVLLKGVDASGFVFYSNAQASRARNWRQPHTPRSTSTGRACARWCGCKAP